MIFGQIKHKKKIDPNSFHSLAKLVLPERVLEYYDLVNVELEENCNDDILYPYKMHIYLDEKDLRTKEQKEISICHGFSDYNEVTDFTIRNRRVVLHYRFRRFKTTEGKALVIPNPYHIKAKGTKVSPDYGTFIKGMVDNFDGEFKTIASYQGFKENTLYKMYRKLNGNSDESRESSVK